MSSRTIAYESHIEASPDEVYEILIDVESYEEWNPFTPWGEGTPVAGGPLIKMKADMGFFRINVEHEIITMDPGREFTWRDTGFFTRFVCGQRSRILTPSESGGTDYRVAIDLTGPLVALGDKMFGPAMTKGMKAETLALKKRAEALA